MLTQLVNVVSRRVEEFTSRELLRRNAFTEYFSGMQYRYSVPLRAFPIVSITSLWDDPNLDYDSVINTEAYTHNPDTGILYLKNGTFATAYRNIKVTYVGGYAEFIVYPGVNDKIIFREATTGAYSTATVADGRYTAESLATEIKTALDAAGGTYTCTYSSATRKFTITQTAPATSFEILLNTGDASYVSTNIYATIGFVTGAAASSNKTGALAYTTTNPTGSVPDDLQWAIVEWIAYLFEQTRGAGPSDNRFGISGKSIGDSSASYFLRDIPTRVKEVIQSYQRPTL